MKKCSIGLRVKVGEALTSVLFFRRGRVSAESGLLSWGLMRLKQSAGEGIFRRAFLIERLKAILGS